MNSDITVSLVESIFAKEEATILTEVDCLAVYWENNPKKNTMELKEVVDTDTGVVYDSRVIEAIGTESGLFAEMKVVANDYYYVKKKEWCNDCEHEEYLRKGSELSSEEIEYPLAG